MITKTCTLCQKTLPPEMFYLKSGTNKRQARCKKCVNQKTTEYRRGKGRERYNERMRLRKDHSRKVIEDMEPDYSISDDEIEQLTYLSY